MLELFQAAINPVNLILSFLLILVLLYWSMVIIGGLDMDAFDLDLDLDLDLDMDLDVDADIDADLDTDINDISNLSGFSKILVFFNLGTLPLMVFLSFLILIMWVFSILFNYYLNPGNSILFSFLFQIPSFFLSAFATKYATLPLVSFFKKLKSSRGEAVEFSGKVCTLTLSLEPGEMGQAEVMVGSSPLTINVKTTGKSIIKKGEKAVVVEAGKGDKAYYYIEALNS